MSDQESSTVVGTNFALNFNVDGSNRAATADAFDEIFRLVRDRLMGSAPSETKAMAKAASEADELALLALADWLEERTFGELAHRVRSLRVEDGSILVLTHPPDVGIHRERIAITALEDIAKKLFELGINVVPILLPDNCGLSVIKMPRKETPKP